MSTGIPLPDIPAKKKQTAISQYVTNIKELYLDSVNWPLFPREGRWPPLLNEPDHYVNLQLIQHESLPREGEEQETAEYHSSGDVKQILDVHECYSLQHLFVQDDYLKHHVPADRNTKGIRVLMDRAPGIGKTTLAHKACKDWASGKLWTDYQLVAYVPLKDGTFASATELWQLFESDSKKLSQEVAEEVAQVQGEGVIIILDGWDELPELKDTSIIKKILHRRLLRKCSLLVTSRPHASLELIRYQIPDRHFEAVGLTPDQIVKVVTNFFDKDEEKGKILLKEMKDKVGVMNLCYIPLSLAIVLHVYNQEKALPQTLTGLYNLFIRTLLTHQLSLSHLDSITSLPSDTTDIYNAFGELAFDGLQHNSLMFDEQHLQSICSSDVSKQCTLGLLTAFKCCSSSGMLMRYQFTHLTIQEYLAAEHLARQPEKIQTEFIVENINNEKFLVMLQFLFGIAAQKGTITDLSGLLTLLCSTEDPRRLQVLLRLVHETQQEECLKEIGSRLDGKKLTVYTEHWSEHEIQLLALLIDHLKWNFSKLSTCGVSKKMNFSMNQHHANCIYQLIRQRCVTEIEIVTKFRYLYSFLLTYLYNERFTLSSFEIYSQGNAITGRFRFIRRNCAIGQFGMTMEAMAALLKQPQIMERSQADKGLSLLLSQGFYPHTLSIMNLQSIQQLAQTKKHIVSADVNSILQCIASGLETLHLGGYMIFPYQAALVFGAAAVSTDLRILDLSNNWLFQGELRDVAIKAFHYLLTHNKSLRELGLKECKVKKEVLSLIALNNTTIKVLNFDCTHEFPKSVDLQLLTRNLSTLFLSHCYLNDEDATRIGGMLCSNESLQELHLDRNNITVGGAIHIFMGLMDNKSLQHLSIGRQSIEQSPTEATDEELNETFTEIVAAIFQQNKTLKRLSVQIFAPYPGKKLRNLDNELKIYDKNTKEYIKRAHVVNCMQYNLEFYNQSKSEAHIPVILLSGEVFLQLVQCSTLEELNLSGYNLTEPSTMLSLINLLEQNSTMTHLKLFACRLHELQYAPLRKQLFQALYNNQSLTDLSVDPETASVLAGFVDKVNYKRHVMGSRPLTIHTDRDFYELVVRNWNHA